ncbi:phosphate transporter, partial [Haematococcus lacustris]
MNVALIAFDVLCIDSCESPPYPLRAHLHHQPTWVRVVTSTVNGPARSRIPYSHDQTMTVSPEHNAGYDWLIVVGILGAFCFGFGTGANDLGNSFGTSVGTRTLTMGQAIALAAAAEFTGAMLLGHTSTNTIAGGIADINAYTSYPEVFAYGMMVSLIVSGCWQITASYYELNVSSTHSIIGCIIGFSLVFDGNNAVLWSQPDPKSSLRFKPFADRPGLRRPVPAVPHPGAAPPVSSHVGAVDAAALHGPHSIHMHLLCAHKGRWSHTGQHGLDHSAVLVGQVCG